MKHPFLYLLIILIVPIAIQAESGAPARKEKEEETSFVVKPVRAVTVKPGGSAERAMLFHHRWRENGGKKVPLDTPWAQLSTEHQTQLRKLMAGMYGEGGRGRMGFDNVALLFAKGLEHPGEDFRQAGFSPDPLPHTLSVRMAEARDAFVEQALHAAAKDEALDRKIRKLVQNRGLSEGEWRIGRSDSGNVDSGMKSDLDQTLFVMARHPQGHWVHLPEGDDILLAVFEEKEKGVSPQKTE